jgi:hypothetical protein
MQRRQSNLVQVTNPKRTRYVKALVFAPGGHGKTHLLGTAQDDPRTYPMLFLDFEGGEDTLVGLDIDIVAIRSWADYDEVYDVLASGQHWKLSGSSLREGEQYKSLGIDSISETHIWALLTVLAKGARRREDSDTRDPDALEQRDYGIASTQMRRLMRDFRDLPLHVFYTSGSKEIRERKVGMVKVPSLAGQMADEAVHIPSVVGYLALAADEETGEDVRVLILKGQGFRTKVRTPWGTTAPDEIEDPSITKLLDALRVGDDAPVEDAQEPPPRVSGSAARRHAAQGKPSPASAEETPDNGGDDEQKENGTTDVRMSRVELKAKLDELGIQYSARDKTSQLLEKLAAHTEEQETPHHDDPNQ